MTTAQTKKKENTQSGYWEWNKNELAAHRLDFSFSVWTSSIEIIGFLSVDILLVRSCLFWLIEKFLFSAFEHSTNDKVQKKVNRLIEYDRSKKEIRIDFGDFDTKMTSRVFFERFEWNLHWQKMCLKIRSGNAWHQKQPNYWINSSKIICCFVDFLLNSFATKRFMRPADPAKVNNYCSFSIFSLWSFWNAEHFPSVIGWSNWISRKEGESIKKKQKMFSFIRNYRDYRHTRSFSILCVQ